MNNPLQTVIIPTYNRKEMLAEALDSVLNQSQKSLEVLIIDDCSNDGTNEFVKNINDSRVHYFRNEKNSGPEFNRSYGLRQSRGKYITFLDDDDYYTDYDFFSKAIKIFEEHDSENAPLSFVCANAEILYIETGKKSNKYNIGTPGRVKGVDYILNCTKPLSTFPTVFKAEILHRAGLDNNGIFDTLTYREVVLFGDTYFMSDYIGVYRIHKKSLTLGYLNNSKARTRFFAIVNEEARRLNILVNNLYGRIDKKILDNWYEIAVFTELNQYAISIKSIKDIIKEMACFMKHSGFRPRLWAALIKWSIRTSLSKITLLRKVFRFIKYRGKIPEDE